MATTVTREEFLAEHPEFDKAPVAVVDRKLAAAHRQLSESVWCDAYRDGVVLLAARLLALHPEGRKLRLVNQDGSTIYDEDWKRLRRSIASGFRVI